MTIEQLDVFDDSDVIVCGRCDKEMNPYEDHVYYEYNEGGTILVYLCDKCIHS